MQQFNYSRFQRRHNHFVLEREGQFLCFAKDKVRFGFRELEHANVFNHKKAWLIQQAIKDHYPVNIKMLVKIKGEITAL